MKPDFSGRTFNCLTFVKFLHVEKSRNYWLCKCICGNEKIIDQRFVVNGKTKSCGCIRGESNKLTKKEIIENILSNIKISKTNCWEWQKSFFPNGYGQYNLSRLKIQSVHRLSWHVFKDKIPKGKFVLHKCDNKKCCNPEHLYVGTAKDNARDALQRGQFPTGQNKKKSNPGEKNNKAKLSNEKVKYIRFLCENGFRKSEIAKFFYVNKSTILNISKGKTWQCV